MFQSEKIKIQSVTEITTSIKSKLETDYRFVHIQGEVTNLRCPYSGHLYFALKDKSSQIKAVLFKGKRRYLDVEIADGKEIICHGRVSVYEPRGEYQLIVDTVDDCGFGDLQAKFEQLKKRLYAEGLFDEGVKKPLPGYPGDLVVVTSPSGAALFDFLKIADLRKSFTNISIYPVRVQGKGAAEEIADALDKINKELPTSLIVMCRGGGSIEDLWAFNEECVARAMFRSKIPIITGIGHEIDTTIADFCADFRASTPTGAAELVFPVKETLLHEVYSKKRELVNSISNSIKDIEYRIRMSERILGDLDSVFTHQSLRLDLQIAQLSRSIHEKISTIDKRFQNLIMRLKAQLPSSKFFLQEQRLQHATEKLWMHCDSILDHKRARLAQQMARLDAVSPLSTLARGYSIVTKGSLEKRVGNIIIDSEQVVAGEAISVTLHKGKLECEVIGSLPD
jgi:exodeoxyribonuclease VII large subunit